MRILFFILLSINLYAHQTSLSLLNVQVEENKILGSYKVSLEDAQLLVNLDKNFNREITWQEVLAEEQNLVNQIKTQFFIKVNEKGCNVNFEPVQLDKLHSNTYLHFGFTSVCEEKIDTLALKYTLLFDKDSMHKAYVNVQEGEKTHNLLFSKDNFELKIDLNNTSTFSTFMEFIKQGVIHIFIGIDHILFLVALLLPSVLFMREKQWHGNNSIQSTFKALLFRSNREWYPNSSLHKTLMNVLKIVTAFTVAHSITLTLTILGYISLDSWIVESFIAFSVILAAINNITGTIEKRLWVLVFVFGLIHGMGFASVLMDLELQESSLLTALFGFNLGVELGQIAIVTLLVPVLYLIRNQKWYQFLVLYFGSFLIMLVGVLWLWERVSEGLGL